MSKSRESTPEQRALGDYLKTRRSLLGLSLASVGRPVDLSATYIQNIERGQVNDIGIKSLLDICRGYRVEAANILTQFFGVEFADQPQLTEEDQLALDIGRAVLNLPEKRQKDTIEWISWQQSRSLE